MKVSRCVLRNRLIKCKKRQVKQVPTIVICYCFFTQALVISINNRFVGAFNIDITAFHKLSIVSLYLYRILWHLMVFNAITIAIFLPLLFPSLPEHCWWWLRWWWVCSPLSNLVNWKLTLMIEEKDTSGSMSSRMKDRDREKTQLKQGFSYIKFSVICHRQKRAYRVTHYYSLFSLAHTYRKMRN